MATGERCASANADQLGLFVRREEDHDAPIAEAVGCLWKLIPDASLTIVDRGFLDAGVLIPLARDGASRHWMTRARTTSSYEVVKKLGKGDALVELEVSSTARKLDESLPRRWTVRAIDDQRPGVPPQVLLTSMLDTKRSR